MLHCLKQFYLAMSLYLGIGENRRGLNLENGPNAIAIPISYRVFCQFQLLMWVSFFRAISSGLGIGKSRRKPNLQVVQTRPHFEHHLIYDLCNCWCVNGFVIKEKRQLFLLTNAVIFCSFSLLQTVISCHNIRWAVIVFSVV